MGVARHRGREIEREAGRLTGAFPRYIIGLLLDGELHRFTTYTGSVLERLEMSDSHLHLRIRNRSHRLNVDSKKSRGAILHAPYEKQMIARVAGTMTSEADIRLTRLDDETVIFEGRGANADSTSALVRKTA